LEKKKNQNTQEVEKVANRAITHKKYREGQGKN